jgi:hypothetical protein
VYVRVPRNIVSSDLAGERAAGLTPCLDINYL